MASHRKLAHSLQSEANIRLIGSFYQLLLFALVIAVFCSCATTPEPGPTEAVQALELYYKHHGKFLRETCPLLQEIELLSNHPGWSDMAKIVKSEPSIRHLEGAQEAERKTSIAIEEWSRKWEAPGDRVYASYRSLAERSKQLNAERLGLLSELPVVHAKMIAYAASLRGDAKILWFGIANDLDKDNRENLSCFGINSLDLLEADTQKLKHLLPNFPWP